MKVFHKQSEEINIMDYTENYYCLMTKMTHVMNQISLDKFESLIRCDHIGGHLVLDVGCGDGSSTVKILKPFLGSSVELEASDISELTIKYAEQNHSGRGVMFFVWDVRDEMLAREMSNKYDHVYSFFCLQFVQEQRKALKNIYDILKPGGSFFFTTLTHLPFYEAFRKLSQYPRWGPYLQEKDISRYSAPYQHESDPLRAYSDLMEECGFKDIRVKRSSEEQRLDSWNKFVGLAKFGDQFCDKLPEELRDQYMKDYLEELKSIKGFVSERTDEYGEPYLAIYDDDYRYLICYGLKPGP